MKNFINCIGLNLDFFHLSKLEVIFASDCTIPGYISGTAVEYVIERVEVGETFVLVLLFSSVRIILAVLLTHT